ncbi:MAG: thiamine diphosphokinase, partial [Clostridiales bacterium GWC2_40_7]
TKSGVEIVRFPAKKDATDTQLAVQLAMERGCDEVILLGSAGTRLDHTMANVFLLRMLLEAGKKGIIADEHNEIEMIDKNISLVRENDIKISLVPVGGKVTGVTTEGLYYPLKDATLEFGSTWGISNEFSEDLAGITIKEGLLLVIRSKD